MTREQSIRETAYAIWEAEGRPDGRHAEHWRLAEASTQPCASNLAADSMATPEARPVRRKASLGVSKAAAVSPGKVKAAQPAKPRATGQKKPSAPKAPL